MSDDIKNFRNTVEKFDELQADLELIKDQLEANFNIYKNVNDASSENINKFKSILDGINQAQINTTETKEEIRELMGIAKKLSTDEKTIFENFTQQGYNSALKILNQKISNVTINSEKLDNAIAGAVERHIELFDEKFKDLEKAIMQKLEEVPDRTVSIIETAAKTVQDLAINEIKGIEFHSSELTKAVNEINKEQFDEAAAKINALNETGKSIESAMNNLSNFDTQIEKWNQRIKELEKDSRVALINHKKILEETESTYAEIARKGSAILEAKKPSTSGYLVFGIFIGVFAMIGIGFILRHTT